MIIRPKVRGFVCITAHPTGCRAHVQEQIDHVQSRAPITGGPKNALIIGASTGYGLSSRIAAAFGAGAGTVGVFFERPSEVGRTGTAGWYNAAAFHRAARTAGLPVASINGDAFSDAIKEQTIAAIKRELGRVDLVIYSLASPRRVHPRTGAVHKSVLKPIGAPFTGKTVDTDKGIVSEITIEPATRQEIDDTVAVMGGEDWELWMEALAQAGVLAPGTTSCAFDYVGPEMTWPIYHHGTIGEAKKHLRESAQRIDASLKANGYGRAFISVNKALVTQASSAIPVVPLYISILYRVMKEKGLHEGTIEQLHRLFSTQLYNGGAINFDAEGRARVDDWEMRPEIQAAVAEIWPEVTTANLEALTDIQGYRAEFLKLFGFGLPGIDYEADTDPEVSLDA